MSSEPNWLGKFSPLAAPIFHHDIQANDRGIAVLNRYVVLFKWGETKTFYEAELESAAA